MLERKGSRGRYLDMYPNSDYDPTEYERPVVTTDLATVTLIDGVLNVLLIKRKKAPFEDMWAIPGGFVDIKKSESSHTAAIRELEEETNVTGLPVHYLGLYDDPDRDPRWRVLSNAYFALVPYSEISKQKIEARDDAKEFAFFELDSLPKLAFDHNQILQDLRDKIRKDAEYTDILFSLVPYVWTWKQLHEAYQAAIGRELHMPNFRRRILRMFNIASAGSKDLSANSGRTPEQFRFEGIADSF